MLQGIVSLDIQFHLKDGLKHLIKGLSQAENELNDLKHATPGLEILIMLLQELEKHGVSLFQVFNQGYGLREV